YKIRTSLSCVVSALSAWMAFCNVLRAIQPRERRLRIARYARRKPRERIAPKCRDWGFKEQESPARDD
ncbi:MAG TPA: hypothetical protein VFY05_07085, partial [Candidatus Angelobacter sp.]|nr:hypothetical protein [Candidatus Angelobacter sp.]